MGNLNDWPITENELIAKTLASRYASVYKNEQISIKIILLTASLYKNNGKLEPTTINNINVGDDILMDVCILKDLQLKDSNKSADKEITTLEMRVESIFADGDILVIESEQNVYSTIDFSKHLEEEVRRLETTSKTIEQIIAEATIKRNAPTLLMQDLRFLELITKREVGDEELRPDMTIIASGKQIADISMPEWYSNMLISLPITIDKIIHDPTGLIIIAKNGPILTTIDCRPEFALEKAKAENSMIEKAIQEYIKENKKLRSND